MCVVSNVCFLGEIQTMSHIVDPCGSVRSWVAICPDFTLQMMMQPSGWKTSEVNHWNREKKTCVCCEQSSPSFFYFTDHTLPFALFFDHLSVNSVLIMCMWISRKLADLYLHMRWAVVAQFILFLQPLYTSVPQGYAYLLTDWYQAGSLTFVAATFPEKLNLKVAREQLRKQEVRKSRGIFLCPGKLVCWCDYFAC